MWNSGARKEAFELLEHLWATGDDKIREELTEALVSGPPAPLVDEEEPEKALLARDRRVFDRISLLLKANAAPLSPRLETLHAEIINRHPNWQLPEGDQAKFGIWMESRWGPDTRYSIDYLRTIVEPSSLFDLLCDEQEDREGLLDIWRQFAGVDPNRALGVIEALNVRDGAGPFDLWRATLWGLRDALKDSTIRERLIDLLNAAPHTLIEQVEFSRELADILEASSSRDQSQPTAAFWALFDRVLLVAADDPENGDMPDDGQWVFTAINRSLGHLATAFFNALFAYRLKAGDGIPPEHLGRLNALIGGGRRDHRFARVVASSRLPYLFAVDPDWSRRVILPSMDWVDEEEAMAFWQGFAWHPRVGPELWADIRSSFLECFTPERLQRFGDFDRTLAQLLMLLGIEL